MPLIFKKKSAAQSTIAVWKITEEEPFFLERLGLSKQANKQLSEFKGRRRMEWIASRFLIQYLLPKKINIEKDQYGKPYLSSKEYFISISHSYDHVAVIISKQLVGIDLQKKVDKIKRIAHKFINAQEDSFIHNRSYLSNLHLIWGAKECLFKAYGKKNVDFKKDLHVEPFTYRKQGYFKGWVDKKDYFKRFNFENHFIKNFYLVYAESKI